METNNHLDSVFYALADERRRLMLELLAEKPRTVSELALHFDGSMGYVSKNIKLLEKSALIYKIKKGRSVYCHMNFDTWTDIAKYFSLIAQFWNNKLKNLEDFINGMK